MDRMIQFCTVHFLTLLQLLYGTYGPFLTQLQLLYMDHTGHLRLGCSSHMDRTVRISEEGTLACMDDAVHYHSRREFGTAVAVRQLMKKRQAWEYWDFQDK